MANIVYGCIVPHPPIAIPEIGKARTVEVASTQAGMRAVAAGLEAANPDVVVLISPHGETSADAMGVAVAPVTRGNFDQWGVRGLEYSFENDSLFVDILKEEAKRGKVPIKNLGEHGYNLDHGVLVPMYFLAESLLSATLVPVTFSWLSTELHFAFGKAIARAAEKSVKRVAIIASGDMSHRLMPGAPAGYNPLGRQFDQKIVEAVGKNDTAAILNMDRDFLDAAGECGYRSIVILMGALESTDLEPRHLSYEGPFGVGYLVAAFESKKTENSGEIQSKRKVIHPLVNLAKSAVENYIKTGEIIGPPMPLTEEMSERRGVFVSLKDRYGQLRGCIGTFEPARMNVAEEIIINSISSATRDPRFYPVSHMELPNLTYSVDLLGTPERVDGLEALDPKRYGVIVQSGFRKGLLLPDLEGVESAVDQVRIAREKAGIRDFEPVDLFRFEVMRYT